MHGAWDELSGRQHGVELAVLRAILPSDNASPTLDLTMHGDQLVELVARERLWGLAAQACDHGAIAVDQATKERLGAGHRASMVFALAVESVVIEVASALRHAGIERRLLKGAATARLLYPTPELRDTGDVDLLVRPRDFEAAIAALSTIGVVTRRWPAPGNAHLTSGHERTLLHPSGVEVDLHRRVQAMHRNSSLSEATLFANPLTVEIGGHHVDTLSLPALFIHAALHLATRDTRASTLADLVRMTENPALDVAAALTLARTERVSGWVHWALDRTADVSELPARCWQARFEVPASRIDRATAHYLQTHPSAGMLIDLLAEPGRVRLMGELVWPSDEFLLNLGRTRASHLGHLAVAPLRFLRPKHSRVGVARRAPTPPPTK